MTTRRTLPSAMPALVAALLLGACDGDKPATAPEGGAASPAKTGDKTPGKDAPVADAGKGGEKVKTVDGKAPGGDDRYALQIEAPEAKAGQPAQVTVKVVPKAPWHMNLDFPTSLKVTAPDGVTLDKPDLKKADAKLDESACQFDVKFTPASAGESTFTGKFKFAVCQDDACSPVTEDVEFKVAVK